MSEIRVTTVSNAAGTGPVTLTKQHAAKVWIAFDQGDSASSVQSIDGSFNVSSISDGGTGETVINFSNNMADGNHATKLSVGSGAANRVCSFNLPRVNLCKVETYQNTATSAADAGEMAATIHGDLA